MNIRSVTITDDVTQPKVVQLLSNNEVRLPDLVVQLLDQDTRFGIHLIENI